MAYPNDFVTTVVKVGADVAQQFAGDRQLFKSAYMDINLDEVGSTGKTATIVFPGLVTVSNDASSVGTFNAPTTSTKTLTLSQMPSVNLKVLDWEEAIARPAMIRDLYVQPALIAIRKYLNGQMATLMDTTDLPTYTPVPSVTVNTLTLSQLRDARILLSGNNVPYNDLGNMSLVMQPTVYENTMASDAFNRADIQGPDRAQSVWTNGALLQTFATNFYSDHDMPTVDTTIDQRTSCLFHKYAFGAAYRPMEIPPPSTGVVGSYIDMDGIPIRFLFSYSHDAKAYLLSFDLAFGFTVLRPEFAVLIYSAVSA